MRCRAPRARVTAARLLALAAAAGGVLLAGCQAGSSMWPEAGRGHAQRPAGGDLIPSGFAERVERDAQIAVWREALAVDSTSALVLAQLAALHLQRSREGGGFADVLTSEALARRSLATRVRRNGRAAATLASSLMAQHRFADARQVAEALVRREPEEPVYRALLGELALELGDRVAADSLFRGVWHARGHLSVAPRLARWAETAGHVAAARRLLETARATATARRDVARETKAWFHLREGELALRSGRLRAARRSFRAGLDVEPDDHRLMTAMGRWHLARGDARGAVEWAGRAMVRQPDPAALVVLVEAWSRLGDSANAEGALDALQALTMQGAAERPPPHRDAIRLLVRHGRLPAPDAGIWLEGARRGAARESANALARGVAHRE